MTPTENRTDDLPGLLEKFWSAGPDDTQTALSPILKALKNAIRDGELAEAELYLKSLIGPALDYSAAQSLYGILKKLRAAAPAKKSTVKLAVLGSSTTHQIVEHLDLQLFAMGVNVSCYEADYGVFRQEILDPTSQLYSFRPDILFLAVDRRDLNYRPTPTMTRAEADALAQKEAAEWLNLWNAVHKNLDCQILQNNFVAPAARTYANLEMRHAASTGRYIAEVNRALVEQAPAFVTIHDIDTLAANRGRWEWDDPRFFHLAKLPCSPSCFADYAHSLGSLIAAQKGLAKKCLVLDLDNTLWGGVIGDDGLGGIRLGQGSAEGEAFLAFQQYAKDLQARGVILAVCSKNTDSVAREVFEKHQSMVLRLDDISCFVANWEDKAGNLRRIAQNLNIGLNSLVFVDDNPAERALVRRMVPEVAVPELPEDPSYYPRAVDQHRYFQTLAISAEDLARTSYYRSDQLRQELETSASDMEAFLSSLQMVARTGPIESATLERSLQLIARSNQFNLTTRRWTAGEMAAALADDSWITRTVSLADRFGDNGLICVLAAHALGDTLDIDTWLMSCRVLKRGVEQFLLNHVCQIALDRGLKKVTGRYISTVKNALVKDHYRSLGFTQVGETPEGTTHWELDLTGDWQPLNNFIREASPLGH